MMQAKGIVDLVIRDKTTLTEISRTQHENLILDSTFLAMTQGGRIGSQILIGTATAPMYSTNDIIYGSKTYALGYNEASTPSPQFVEANGSVPAYTQYKQRFDPPATGVTRNITSIQLTDIDEGTYNELKLRSYNTNYQYNNTKVYAGFILPTACVQTDTQVLDVYYRIQWILPSIPSFNAVHLYRSARYYSNLYNYGYPDSVSSTVFNLPANPNRVTVSLPYFPVTTTSSYTYLFPQDCQLLASELTQTTDTRLYKKTFSWSLGLSNQVGKIFGTYLFGPGSVTLAAFGSVNGVASGYNDGSRIQPVHNHNSLAAVPFIDVNTLANGAGVITPAEDAGGWTSITKYPELYKVDIITGGDVGTSSYNFKMRRHLGFQGNTFQNHFEVIPHFTDERIQQNYTNIAAHGVVGNPSSELAERYDVDTLLTANATGVSKANIATGALQSWDATTVPALPVTAITDIRYDAVNKILWVASTREGLFKINVDSPYTVTQITTVPTPASQFNCFAVEVGANGAVWAMFSGGLANSNDSGVTWTVYSPASTPAFNIVGISDDHWNTVRSMRIDPKSTLNQMLIIRDPATTILPNLNSVWWSTAAPDTTVTAQYWRVLYQDAMLYYIQQYSLKFTQFQFKNSAGTVLSNGGSALSSYSSTSIASGAFDQSGVTSWGAGTDRRIATFWIGYNFNTPVNITQAAFAIANTEYAIDVAIICTLQYSNDGINWNTSAYLGTNPAANVNTRDINLSFATSYALVPLTAGWPLSAEGPRIDVTQVNRFSMVAAPHSSHFIKYDNNGIMNVMLYQFGTTYTRINTLATGRGQGSNRIIQEIDPNTGANLLLTITGDGSLANISTEILNEFGEKVAETIITSNQVVYRPNVTGYIYFYGSNLTGRTIYMGNGIITFLRSSNSEGSNGYTSTLVTGQVFTNLTSMTGGYLSALVWDSYGWNGFTWIKNYNGAKPTHADPQSLINGINLKFANAVTGVSYSATDYYNFGVCEGVWKDNATTINGSYSYYFKPTLFNVPYFSTSTVQSLAGVTGITTILQGTRGMVPNPNNTIATGAGQTTAFTKELVFGDFEVQFTMPTPTITGMSFGLVPASLKNVTYDDPTVDATSYNLSATLGGPAASKNRGADLIYTSTQLTAGEVYSIKRVNGVVTWNKNGVVIATAAGTDNTLAYRPYVMMRANGSPTQYSELAAVNIISNGSVLAAYCGSVATTSGVYDPYFHAVDDSNLKSFKMSLNGVPVVAKYTDYNTVSIGVNEILLDGISGIVYFSSLNTGNTITGSFTQFNN